MKNYVLKYSQPAKLSDNGWQNDVLPIGNGYMGMCVFGQTDIEHLQFNEKTLWAGGPSKSRPDYNGGNIKGSHTHLLEIQSALKNGDKKAANLLKNKLIGIEEGYGNYLNFGDVVIDFGHKNTSEYTRGLDINNAVAFVEYICDGVKYRREHFASYPSNVIATRIVASKNKLSFSVKFDLAQENYTINNGSDFIEASGSVVDNGLDFLARLGVSTDGQLCVLNGTIVVVDATFAELYLCAGTNYAPIYPHYRGKSPQESVVKNSIFSLSEGWSKLLTKHTTDYKKYFDRVAFDIGGKDTGLNTNELISQYKRGNNDADKFYEELLFAYGRYLIISSSRLGSLPANLQGVWNNSNAPAWGSDYHLNVNLQMCYWHTYVAGLPEMAKPLIDYLETLREPGRVCAKEYHNIVSDDSAPENGWVCHVQCTPFGWTCPGWDFNWGWSPASSSWMMQNIFDYYAFTEDKKLLAEKIYPTMKENAKFWLQNLIFDEKQSRWVSSPSYSPEHGPISVGNAYEQGLVYMLFGDTILAGEALGEDESFLAKLREIRQSLSPFHIGKWGQIKEWYEEDEWYKHKIFKRLADKQNAVQKKHRHSSHLIPLYPGLEISRDTPKLLKAAIVSLRDRGYGGLGNSSGWGKANKINMWARVKDGNSAYEMINSLLKHNISNNLWDVHPPYQMDGNCGYTSGVCEMLLFSDFNCLELLPALPAFWRDGEVSGLCARGNYSVDMKWSDNKLVSYKISSSTKTSAKVIINGNEHIVETNKTFSV